MDHHQRYHGQRYKMGQPWAEGTYADMDRYQRQRPTSSFQRERDGYPSSAYVTAPYPPFSSHRFHSQSHGRSYEPIPVRNVGRQPHYPEGGYRSYSDSTHYYGDDQRRYRDMHSSRAYFDRSQNWPSPVRYGSQSSHSSATVIGTDGRVHSSPKRVNDSLETQMDRLQLARYDNNEAARGYSAREYERNSPSGPIREEEVYHYYPDDRGDSEYDGGASSGDESSIADSEGESEDGEGYREEQVEYEIYDYEEESPESEYYSED